MKLHPNYPLPYQKRARAAKAAQKQLAIALYQQEQLSLAKDIDQGEYMGGVSVTRTRFNAAPMPASHNWFSLKFLQDGPLRDTILGLSHMDLGFLAPHGEVITLIKRHIRNPIRLHLKKYVPWNFTLSVGWDRDDDGDTIPNEPENIQGHEV